MPEASTELQSSTISTKQISVEVAQDQSEAEKARQVAERARLIYGECCRKLKTELTRTGVGEIKNADAPLAMLPGLPDSYHQKCLNAKIDSVKKLILCQTRRLRRILGGNIHVRRVNTIIHQTGLGMTRKMGKKNFERLIKGWIAAQ